MVFFLSILRAFYTVSHLETSVKSDLEHGISNVQHCICVYLQFSDKHIQFAV